MLETKKIRNIGNLPGKTYFDFGDLRVHTISRIVLDGDNDPCYVNLSPSYGLAIEQRNSNNSYFVICFVKYDKKEDGIVYEPVGERILDYIGDDFEKYSIFKEAYTQAKHIIGEDVIKNGEKYES